MTRNKYIVFKLPIVHEGEKEPRLTKLKMLRNDINHLKEVAWDSYSLYSLFCDNTETVKRGIEHLQLSGRTYNLLRRKELTTIDKLINKGIKNLRKEKGIGDKTIKEIIDALGNL